MKLYLGLVHAPVLNKKGIEVTTSVTNMDLHDISRSCCTFGVKKYFIITPLQAQHEIMGRMLSHWETSRANEYNPDRQEALDLVELQNTIETSMMRIKELEEIDPLLAVTGANFTSSDGDFLELHELSRKQNRPVLLLFGTGWGLPGRITESADFKLGPIHGLAADGYNHLSVRSAVAIYLDRFARTMS